MPPKLTRDPSAEGPVLLRDYSLFGARRLIQTWNYGLADRIEEKLPKIEAPALVISGTSRPTLPE